MNKISSIVSEIKEHYDVVVIGSGYGGGIAASRLSRAGKKVCLLERGREFIPGEFPDNIVEAEKEMQLDLPEKKIGSNLGLFNFHIGKDVNVLVGCGLGGTSLINANVALKLDPRVWHSGLWPKAIVDDLDNGVAKGYDRAEEMLKPNRYPLDFPSLNKLEAHKKSGESLKQPFYRAPINVTFEDKINHVGVEQKRCTNCGDCVSGCNHNAKNTTQMNYLPDAWNHGCDIFTQCHVDSVARENGHWRVYYQALGLGREKFDAPDMFITADHVIVSAGTLGSTEIMLRSAQKGLALSSMVGKRFTGNGDVLAFGWNSREPIHGIGYGCEEVSPEKQIGPCITSIIDTRETATNYRDGMSIEEGSIPGALKGILTSTFSLLSIAEGEHKKTNFQKRETGALEETVRTAESMVNWPYNGAADHAQTYLIMTHDNGNGTISLTEQNQLLLNWPGYGNEPIFKKANEILKECAFALDATFLKNPIWSKAFGHDLISVHPLGGCIMGEDAGKGVVNHKGQVFNPAEGPDAVYDGLYITDGSVMPTSLGTNPLFTISAISERNIAIMAKERGWTIDYTLPSKPREVQPVTVGVRFTETMKGFYSEKGSNFEAGYAAGKSAGMSIEFTLTVVSDDVEKLINTPSHTAVMSGTVLAPFLSAKPIMVTEGIFNLFEDYAREVATKRMDYAMKLTTVEGKTYYFKGYKEVNDNQGPRIWHDTSTLYITLFNGPNDKAPALGIGIQHIELADFEKQMTTMKITNAKNVVERLEYMAKFGRYFGGSLWQIYGGIFRHDNYFNPTLPAREKRPLNVPAPAYHFFETDDGLILKLTRYKGGEKGPVILCHGLGVSSQIFATDTIDTNLLEYLVANTYDVWLLDYRSSIDLPYATQQFSGDDVAKYDYPAAVNTVRNLTGKDTVQMIVHCWGATTWTMAMLSGLKHVRSAAVSQVAAHAIAGRLKKLEAGIHMPNIMEKLGMKDLTAYTDTKAGFWDGAFNKALDLWPMEKEERCNNPVCHRVTFLYALLYEHSQLNAELHNNLHELFGVSCLRALTHLTTIIRNEHIVDENGNNIYLPNLKDLNIPTLFISGAENQCYLPETTELTYKALCELNGKELYKRAVIPAYGHIDCMFGKNASKDVYPLIVSHLNETA